MVRVSIIIPVYNAERYLEQCVDSVIRQSLQELEILCVNDGSTDNSFEILKRMQAQEARMVILQQENQGAGAARNLALKQAKGEYILFLDADDYLMDVKALQRMYESCKENQVLVCGGFLSRDMFGKVSATNQHRELCKRFPEGKKLSYREYQYDYNYTTYLYSRTMLLENRIEFPRYRRFQDPPFFVKAMIVAKDFFVLPVELYCYRGGYQNYRFDIEKTADIIRGLTDNLIISAVHGLKQLHLLTLARLNESFFIPIVESYTEEDDKTLSLLLKANQNVRWDWTREKIKLIKPLLFLLHAGQDRCRYYQDQMKEYDEHQGWIFPFHKIAPGSRIILYAAGGVGYSYYQQIQERKEYSLVLWVDKNVSEEQIDLEHYEGSLTDKEKEPEKIMPISHIMHTEFDVVVIAVADPKTAGEISEELQTMGVAAEKIIWTLSWD